MASLVMPSIPHPSSQPSPRLPSFLSTRRATPTLVTPAESESEDEAVGNATPNSAVGVISSTNSTHPLQNADASAYPPTPNAAELQRPLPASRSHLAGRSLAFKMLFLATTLMTQLLSQAQVGMVFVPLGDIGRWLKVEDVGEESWMAASFGLTVGMFLLPAGRLGDLYGPKRLWLLGTVVVALANLASGFCSNRIAFDITRAFAGCGFAMSVPNAVSILGRIYPPGNVRALVFATLGALGPIGFVWGGAVSGLFAKYASIKWIWFFSAILSAVMVFAGYFVLPADKRSRSSHSFDVVGTILLALGLGLFNFAWNQGPVAGWSQEYVWALLLVSVAAFGAFFVWERRMGNEALIPLVVMQKNNLFVFLSLWLGWMSLGGYWYYMLAFLRTIKGIDETLLLSAYVSPVTPVGILCAFVVPVIITRFAGHHIFLVSMVSFFIGNGLAAINPTSLGYWPIIFPSIVLLIPGPDLSFATGQLIVSNSVDMEYQGIASGVVSMIVNYSMSIGLGMAGTVERYVRGAHGSELKGYRAAFYFGTGLAGVAVLIVAAFVRMPKQAHYRE